MAGDMGERQSICQLLNRQGCVGDTYCFAGCCVVLEVNLIMV